MRIFIKNLLLFVLPLAVFLAFPFTVLLWSGEFYPLDAIGKLSNGPQVILVGQAYNNYGPELGLNAVIAREPRVITLGNSHVGAFSSMFFNDRSVFYNTTGMVGTLSDYVQFVEQLKGKPPEIILANMEPNMFNPENAKNNVVRRSDLFAVRGQVYDPFFESLFRNGGWWKVYADYFSGKFMLSDVFTAQQDSVVTIGLRALADRTGFTNDGSNYPGDVIHNPANQSKILPAINELASTISTNTKFNQYGNQISSEAIAELKTFLSLCKSHGITVIGFFPPFAHEIYVALREQYGQTESFKQLGPTLAALYAEYGFDFYDFSDITTFGSSDAEMVEIQHGSEKMYLRMFIVMADGTPALAQLANTSFLKEKLASATSTYYVFGINGN